MALIDDIKLILRISADAYDTEIEDLIDSAKADLGLSGVLNVEESDSLIKRAIITYVKAYFGWNNPDSEKLQKAYDMLKGHITLSREYSYYSVTFSVLSNSTAVREAKVELIEYTDTTARDDQIKYTDSNGEAMFYVRAGSNYEYSVSADGYTPSTENLIDITDSTSITVVLEES